MTPHPWDPAGYEGPPEIELPPYRPYRRPGLLRAKPKAPQGPRTSPWAWVALAGVVGAAGYLQGESEHMDGVVEGVSAAKAEILRRFKGALAGAGLTTSGPGEPADAITAGDGGADEREQVARMEYVQGDGQEADVGTLLSQPFGVEVRDADDRPMRGVEVHFRVISGGGLVAPSVAHTDEFGRASTRWQLGVGPGFQRLAAMSPVSKVPVTFTAIARDPLASPSAAASAPIPQPASAIAPESTPRDVRPAPPPAPPEPRDGPSVESRAAPRVGPDAGPIPLPFDPRPRPLSVPRRDLAVGGSSVCVLSATRVTCRGANDHGQDLVRGAAGSRAVTAGVFHACVLDPAGVASCWGANEVGQLGDGTRVGRDVPTPVATSLRFTMLSAGLAHTCGLTGEGEFACWGQNTGGQLGDGSRQDRQTPGRASGPPFRSLVAGWSHTCATTDRGAAYCWGLNREGQLGDGSRLDGLWPQQVATGVDALAAGNSHTCALSDGRLLCWGDNRFGQLGDGTHETRVRPTPVAGLPGAPLAVVAGAAHTCALLVGGSAYCWGQNLHGQLGIGSTTNVATPTPVAGALVFSQLAAGGALTCGRTAGGDEYCWGLNQSGQLGDGTLSNQEIPTRVGG